MATVNLNPAPPRQPSMASGDTDARYYDLSADLTPLGVTIASIGSIVATRVDGAATDGTDLAILTNPTPWLSGKSLVVNWWQAATIAVATDYLVTVAVATTDARTLHYACYQLVKPAVG